MIKKINIALGVVFVVLFGCKFALDTLKAAKAARAHSANVASAVQVADGVSTLAPHVYYYYRNPFFSPNRITNRNGIIMDVIRAVFPRAEFRPLMSQKLLEDAEKILETDPQAVIAEIGWHDAQNKFQRSAIPLTFVALSLYLRRDVEWTYQGVKSLDKLRIGWTAESNGSRVLADFAEKWRDTPGKAVYTETCQYPQVAYSKMLADNKLDAFAFFHACSDTLQDTTITYRRSQPIDFKPIYLRMSKLDPDYTRQLQADCSAGLKRLMDSGEWERTLTYYAHNFGANTMAKVTDMFDRPQFNIDDMFAGDEDLKKVFMLFLNVVNSAGGANKPAPNK